MLRILLAALALCVPLRAAAAAEVPKIAIVIAGDPDETLQASARELEEELTKSDLRVPSDPALRAALQGYPSEGNTDGLDGLRAYRRALGLDPRKDTETFVRIGHISGAHALVVVRKKKAKPIAEVFDVGAERFYEGVLHLTDATKAERHKFVHKRAEAALRRSELTESEQAATPPTASSDLAAPVDKPKKKPWIKKNWPYILAGALLAGTVTYFIVDSQRGGNSPSPPVLRFRPGDSEP